MTPPTSFSRAFLTLVGMLARGPGGMAGFPLFFLVGGLHLLSIPIGLYLIQWNADFFNALQRVDAAAAIHQIGVFGLITLASASRYLVANYMTKRLQIRWRTTLTSVLLDRWLQGHAYWRMERAEAGNGTDNPDQRIAEDSRIFVEKLTDETLQIVTCVVGLCTYVPLLWSLSNFPLQFSLLGMDVRIDHYMVWAAPIYVAISSGITHVLGVPLIRLSMEQQRREADFRFSLARVREYAEPIALAGGERAERKAFDRRYAGIVENFRRLINRDLILGIFTRPYMQTVLQIPLFLALPAYLAGHVALGGLMQLRSSFQQVVTNLSYFIFSYRDLAALAAATRRLGVFIGDLETGRPDRGFEERLERRVVAGTEPLAWRSLVLFFPQTGNRVAIPDLEIAPGAHTWIRGPSGAGKSTLVKAIAGLWSAGRGMLHVPADALLIVPQRTYVPIDGPAAAAAYPQVEPCASHEIDASLRSVGLDPEATVRSAGRSCRPHGDAFAQPASTPLSGGEQQRLMLARLLVLKPSFAILDEPTSALDEQSEQHLFATLQSLLPETTFVIVAHHRPLGLGIRQEIDLRPAAEDVRSLPLA